MVQGHEFPARTWIHLRQGGELDSVWLPHDVVVQGHLCRGTGNRGWSITFYPEGGLGCGRSDAAGRGSAERAMASASSCNSSTVCPPKRCRQASS
jgi:hypothetical protein